MSKVFVLEVGSVIGVVEGRLAYNYEMIDFLTSHHFDQVYLISYNQAFDIWEDLLNKGAPIREWRQLLLFNVVEKLESYGISIAAVSTPYDDYLHQFNDSSLCIDSDSDSEDEEKVQFTDCLSISELSMHFGQADSVVLNSSPSTNSSTNSTTPISQLETLDDSLIFSDIAYKSMEDCDLTEISSLSTEMDEDAPTGIHDIVRKIHKAGDAAERVYMPFERFLSTHQDPITPGLILDKFAEQTGGKCYSSGYQHAVNDTELMYALSTYYASSEFCLEESQFRFLMERIEAENAGKITLCYADNDNERVNLIGTICLNGYESLQAIHLLKINKAEQLVVAATPNSNTSFFIKSNCDIPDKSFRHRLYKPASHRAHIEQGNEQYVAKNFRTVA